MTKTIVINIVGLTKRLIGEHTPFIKAFLEKGKSSFIKPVLPAVTCSAQSTYLTGKWPSEHGIVGNGWYFKEENEVKFWRQSNQLVQAPKIWDILKQEDKNFTCSNMFWWYNMYTTADYGVTPRPNYLADGRKIPDVYSYPSNLRDRLQDKLGTFPLFNFWGPKTSIKSSQWIADATIETDKLYDPTLTLVYLPHLDYNLQRHGNNFDKIAKDLREIDEVVKDLIFYYESKNSHIILLSEYGITDVNKPIHLNRVLRKNNLLALREERGLELLDAGASEAFAVADHQICHVYIKNKANLKKIKSIIASIDGVENVYEKSELNAINLDHNRSGDLVVLATTDAWFTYYFWEDDKKAPDYARMVDIHKKPGYDPVEMLTNPNDKLVMLKVAWKLVKKKLGFRTILDIIPLNANLIKGSHGVTPSNKEDYPLFITNNSRYSSKSEIMAIEIFEIIKEHIKN